MIVPRQKNKTHRGRIGLLILCLALPLGLAGCCHWTDKSGTRHMFVIGFGVVSVNQTNPVAATVVSAHTLGLTAGQAGITAGYSSSFITAVPVNMENVLVEASRDPFRIKIEVSQTNEKQKIKLGTK